MTAGHGTATINRTFIVQTPHMTGQDIRSWQDDIRREFARMDIVCPIESDGDYGVATRSFTSSLAYACGMTPDQVLRHGLTPELRSRIRDRNLSDLEQKQYHERQDWRRRLRTRYESASHTGVHRPTTKIIEASWGYHKGVHDGLDIICPPNSPLFAVVHAKVVDVRSGGWWGLGAPSNPDVKSKGDGIIQLEVLETVGPFKKGYHIGYGHAEHARVKEGDVVAAGDRIGDAGLANAWHIHWMINNGSTDKGVGNLDPKPFLDYTLAHG